MMNWQQRSKPQKSPLPGLSGRGLSWFSMLLRIAHRGEIPLLAHRHRSLLLVDVLEEDRKGDEEGDADQVFNTLDVRVIVDQGVQGFHHAGGQHVLAGQFADLPVGLMQGTDMTAILEVARATSRQVTAAGGITTEAEIQELDRHGVHAVVGMAIYTGLLAVQAPPTE